MYYSFPILPNNQKVQSFGCFYEEGFQCVVEKVYREFRVGMSVGASEQSCVETSMYGDVRGNTCEDMCKEACKDRVGDVCKDVQDHVRVCVCGMFEDVCVTHGIMLVKEVESVIGV